MPELRPIRLGFVSLGQGPRPDLEALHQRIFASMGFGLDAVWSHLLDGLNDADLEALRATRDEPAIRALHGPAGATGLPTHNSWFSREALTERLPDAIHALEASNVSAIVLCAAEMLPGLSVRTRLPVILPAEAMAAQAQMLARTRPDARLGLIVYGDRQRAQQRAGWAARPFAARMGLHFSGQGGDAALAIAELAPHRPDLVFIWAYGAGTGAGVAAQISAGLGVPVVPAALAAAHMAVQFVAERSA